jgi:hypothetical protein
MKQMMECRVAEKKANEEQIDSQPRRNEGLNKNQPTRIEG